jgi:SPP1 gp7 family putative phage head morphogenesis protein
MSGLYDDLLKTQHLVEARGNALADDLITALEDARVKVVGKLAELQAKYLTGVAWDAESLARRKAFLEAQRAEIDRLISEIYRGMMPTTLEAAKDVMEYVGTTTGRSFASMAAPSFTVGEAATALSLSTVTAWAEVHTIEGLVLTEWLNTMSKNSVNRIVAAGREAMIQGLSVQATARLLRQKGIEGGVQALESLARTYLLSASNYANGQVFERHKDVIYKMRYSAVLDGRMCLICGNDDGKMFSLDEPRPSLPRHYSCRCLYVPVTDWEKLGVPELANPENERPAVKHDERTVHHKDGTTSTKFTIPEGGVEHTTEKYNAWITRQLREDPAFVKRVLGKTRFELLQSGKITLDKMVVDGRIRRLSEL